MSEYIEHDSDGISVGVVEKKFFTFAEPPHEMILESGNKLGPVTIAYETYGTLSPAKDNAVLILHALSGDSHVAGYYSEDDPKPGWWDIMVGPGKGIDTDKYFVVCSNVLGSCMGSTGPSSINPGTNSFTHRRLYRRHASFGVVFEISGDGGFSHPAGHHNQTLCPCHCL
jgi:homoserine O-acetyltransferase